MVFAPGVRPETVLPVTLSAVPSGSIPAMAMVAEGIGGGCGDGGFRCASANRCGIHERSGDKGFIQRPGGQGQTAEAGIGGTTGGFPVIGNCPVVAGVSFQNAFGGGVAIGGVAAMESNVGL